MVRITGTVHLHDSYTLQGAARQMTRNLSHGRPPRHAQARSIVDQGIKERRRSTRHLAHTSNRGGIRTHIHEGDAYFIALADAALQLTAGTEGIIQTNLHHATFTSTFKEARYGGAGDSQTSRDSIHRHVVDVVQLRCLIGMVSAFVHLPQTPSENPFILLGYYFTIGFY